MPGAPIGNSNPNGKTPNAENPGSYKKSIPFILVIAFGLSLSLVFTVNNQYISKNTTTAVFFPHFPVNRSIDMITVVREPLIVVPFRSALPLPGDIVESTLEVTIFRNNKNISDVNVQEVTLSSPVGSVLTYAPRLSPNNTSPLPNANDYFLKISARHNLEIGNATGIYRINIFYTDPRNPPIYLTNATTSKTVTSQTGTAAIKTAKSTPSANSTAQSPIVESSHTVQVVQNRNRLMQYDTIIFPWPIKTMDLTTLTYFWIVLIGVILSKLSTRIADNEQQPIGTLSNYDYLWIGISAIIALLIFSSFQQQVHLTGNILYNISLAFAFGFGFDRILDTTSNLTKKAIETNK